MYYEMDDIMFTRICISVDFPDAKSRHKILEQNVQGTLERSFFGAHPGKLGGPLKRDFMLLFCILSIFLRALRMF